MIYSPARYYRRLRGARALTRAEAHRAAGRPAAAAADFDLAAAYAPHLRRRALDGAAEAYEALNQRDLALDRLEQLARLDADDAEVATRLTRLRQLSETAPEDETPLQAGLRLYDLGRRAEAAPLLAAGLVVTPDDAGLWRKLAWCRLGEENLAGEIEALRGLLHRAPSDDDARARLIEALTEAGHRGEAEPLLADLIQRRGDDGRLFNQLGRARRSLGDEPGALAAWRQALALNPAEPEANQNIGDALVEAGELSAAADHLERAAPANAKPAVAWLRVARLRREVDDRPAEIRALQQLFVVAASFDLKAHRRLAALLAAEGRHAEAEPHLSVLVAAHPEPKPLRQLARARQTRGDRLGEAAAWRDLLGLIPDDAEARQRLAELHRPA